MRGAEGGSTRSPRGDEHVQGMIMEGEWCSWRKCFKGNS